MMQCDQDVREDTVSLQEKTKTINASDGYDRVAPRICGRAFACVANVH